MRKDLKEKVQEARRNAGEEFDKRISQRREYARDRVYSLAIPSDQFIQQAREKYVKSVGKGEKSKIKGLQKAMRADNKRQVQEARRNAEQKFVWEP